MLAPGRTEPGASQVYIAPVDAGIDEGEWRRFVEDQGFGHLVAAGRDREVPVVVPTQFVLHQDELLLHLVARNPLFDALEEQPRVLMSVAGDWAFIPSAWKAVAGEDPLVGIPTTYYGAVQLIGTATLVDEAERIAEVLRVQLARIQPGMAVADPIDAHLAKLATIRGLRISIEEVRSKFKFGGNVDSEHRLAVVEHLRARGRAGDPAAVAHTLRRLAAER